MEPVIHINNGTINSKMENVFKLVGIDINDLSDNRPWTPDGRDYLIDLYKLGWTAEEMAEEMNRTPGNIIGEIYDLGEAGKITPEMWGVDSKHKQYPKGPLGDISVIIPIINLVEVMKDDNKTDSEK